MFLHVPAGYFFSTGSLCNAVDLFWLNQCKWHSIVKKASCQQIIRMHGAWVLRKSETRIANIFTVMLISYFLSPKHGHVAGRSAGLLSNLKSLMFDLSCQCCNPRVYLKTSNKISVIHGMQNSL